MVVMTPSHLPLPSSMSMALCDVAETHEMLGDSKCNAQYISATAGSSDCGEASLPTLGHLYWFSQLIKDLKQDSIYSEIIVCAGRDHDTITACALAIGSYLVLSEGCSVRLVAERFITIAHLFKVFEFRDADGRQRSIKVDDCWRALSIAKRMHWINFGKRGANCAISMREFLYYDNPANGSIHVIVPSKIVAFAYPTSDPTIATSKTSNSHLVPSPSTHHNHTASYYAEVLSDFDVSLVVQCGGGPYVASSFAARGIATELLGTSGEDGRAGDGPSKQTVDRFLTLARLSPGVIAVHGGGPGLGGVGNLLVAAYLIREHGFGGGEAMAWLMMLRPGGAAPAVRFAVTPSAEVIAAAAAATLRRGRRRASCSALSSAAGLVGAPAISTAAQTSASASADAEGRAESPKGSEDAEEIILRSGDGPPGRRRRGTVAGEQRLGLKARPGPTPLPEP